MARILLLLIIIPLLLMQSCAEVVPLTGGAPDQFAPHVKEQQPSQGSTNYTGNTIVVTFDEYIKLNDPNTTISVNPAGLKVNTELKNKTLTLSWDAALAANTTYIIQLNGTVRDINENNDSIMQFVFSTGSVIDSLSFSGIATGAFSNTAQNQLTVGLYPPDSNPMQAKPVYATRTNAKGEFGFNYLKAGSYQLFAFQDLNKDQKVQNNEPVGFADTLVSLGDTAKTVIRVFPQIPLHTFLRTTFIAPGMAVVHNRDSIDVSKLTINGETAELLQAYSDDSIAVALPEGSASNYVFSYDTLTFTKPFTQSERSVPLAILQEKKTIKWRSGDSLYFTVNDKITTIDTSAIAMMTDKGIPVTYRLAYPRKNAFILIPEPATAQPFIVRFDKAAVTGRSAKSDSTHFSYTPLLSADLSNLKVNLSGFEGQWIIELTQNERVVYTVIKSAKDTSVLFPQIEPGQYNARCIADVNENGVWDTGNFETRRQPEEVHRYTLTQKLRPNWDVEETLTRKP